MLSTDVFGCGAHCRLNGLPCRIHEQFGKPFEEFLYLLGVGSLKIVEGEWYTTIIDASNDLTVILSNAVRGTVGDVPFRKQDTYKSHESVAVVMLLLATVADFAVGLRPRLMAHSCVGVHLLLGNFVELGLGCTGLCG